MVWSYSYNYRHSKELSGAFERSSMGEDGKKAHLREGSKPDARCALRTNGLELSKDVFLLRACVDRVPVGAWSRSRPFRSGLASVVSARSSALKASKLVFGKRLEVSYTHDRDFGQFREWPEGKKERFMGKGWCPPRGKEYQGFVPDVPDDQLPRRGAFSKI